MRGTLEVIHRMGLGSAQAGLNAKEFKIFFWEFTSDGIKACSCSVKTNHLSEAFKLAREAYPNAKGFTLATAARAMPKPYQRALLTLSSGA